LGKGEPEDRACIREELTMSRFVVDERRGRRETRDMILNMGKYGNHNKHFERPFDTDEDVVSYLQDEGFDFERLVDTCRQKDQNVPSLENLFTSEWIGVSPPDGYLVVTNSRGEVLSGFRDGESGRMTMSTYWSRFERAVTSFDHCLETTSYEDLLSALSSGVSSIEAYIGYRVDEYNRLHPGDELMDSRQNKVSFDDKIKEWIPIMSGNKFDKGKNRNWSDFKVLRAVRDQEDAHPKTSAYAHSFKDMCALLNRFRSGIAGLLLDLCIHFGEKQVPTTVIRRAYLPKIRYVAQNS
jgi:hypothetical protein